VALGRRTNPRPVGRGHAKDLAQDVGDPEGTVETGEQGQRAALLDIASQDVELRAGVRRDRREPRV
jgi:hypothetical protein